MFLVTPYYMQAGSCFVSTLSHVVELTNAFSGDSREAQQVIRLPSLIPRLLGGKKPLFVHVLKSWELWSTVLYLPSATSYSLKLRLSIPDFVSH